MYSCPGCTATYDTALVLLRHRLEFHGWLPRVSYRGATIRVMAYAEGYAMCRYPGAMPFIMTVKELALALGDSISDVPANIKAFRGE
jgi:hypothetical protein